MGVDGAVKKDSKRRHPRRWLNAVQVRDLPMPDVVLLDMTYALKYSHPEYANGLDFVEKQIVGEFDPSLRNGAKAVYACFDRGSPSNKYAEHQDRNKKTVSTKTPSSDADVARVVVQSSRWRVDGRSVELKVPRTRNTRRRPTWDGDDDGDDDDDDAFRYLIMRDDRVPKHTEWKNVIGNAELKRQILHYITQCLVYNEEESYALYESGVMNRVGFAERGKLATGYVPPNGSLLFLHGWQSRKPQGTSNMLTYAVDDVGRLNTDVVPFCPDEFVILVAECSHPKTGKKRRLVTAMDDKYPPETVGNLLEGEMAVVYYSLKHSTEDQLWITSDGDMMMMGLMMSRNRIVPGTKFKFANSIHIRLKLPFKKKVTVPNAQNKSGKSTYSVSADDYLDLNGLYEDTVSEKPFCNFEDPVATYVAFSCLMKSDYVKNFAKGLGGSNSEGIPWLMFPFYRSWKIYRRMVVVTPNASGEKDAFVSDRNEPECGFAYSVLLDEKLFLRYVSECYYWVYKDNSVPLRDALRMALLKEAGNRDDLNGFVSKISKGAEESETYLANVVTKHDDLLAAATNVIRKYLKTKRYPMMSPMETLSHARRLRWQLSYWANGYLRDCAHPDPCATANGESYYGWVPLDKMRSVPTEEIYCGLDLPRSKKEKARKKKKEKDGNEKDAGGGKFRTRRPPLETELSRSAKSYRKLTSDAKEKRQRTTTAKTSRQPTQSVPNADRVQHLLKALLANDDDDDNDNDNGDSDEKEPKRTAPLTAKRSGGLDREKAREQRDYGTLEPPNKRRKKSEPSLDLTDVFGDLDEMLLR